MKRHLYIYGLLILIFISYNQFFRVEDERIDTIINILFASFLFLYIGFLAFTLLNKLKKSSKK